MKKSLLSIIISLCLMIVFQTYIIADDNPLEEATDVTYGDWYKKEYIDEFGDATGEIYYGTTCTGSFENTATAGANLKVIVFFEPKQEEISFRLLEYENQKALYLDNSDLVFKYKINDDTFTGSISAPSPNDDLYIGSSDAKKVIASLIEGNDIKVVIYIDNSKYNFIINNEGFGELYNELAEQKENRGIAGIYYSDGDPEKSGGMNYEIICDDDTTGTIVTRMNGNSNYEESNTYTYDADKHLLVTEYGDKFRLIGDYLSFIKWDSFIYEGDIPEKAESATFDAITRNDSGGKCVFNMNGEWEMTRNGETEQKGTYSRKDDYTIIMQRNDGEINISLIYEGDWYSGGCFIRS